MTDSPSRHGAGAQRAPERIKCVDGLISLQMEQWATAVKEAKECRSHNNEGSAKQWDWAARSHLKTADTLREIRADLSRAPALAEECERLRRALEPFAMLADMTPIMAGRGENTRHRNPSDNEAFDWHINITWGMLRAARAALSSTPAAKTEDER